MQTEEVRNYQRKWYWKAVETDPEFRKKQAAYERQRKRKDPRIGMLDNARSRAYKNNIPFNLSKEDIIIPEACPVLKFPLIKHEGIGRANSPSLDRIDPALGYVKGNIQVISMQANAMKNQATKEDLRNFSNWVNQFIS